MDMLMFEINKEEIEIVQEFIFLGTKIVQDGNSTPDIKHRIILGCIAMVSRIKSGKAEIQKAGYLEQ